MSGKIKLEVFTSRSCPYCPAALEIVKEIEGEVGDLIEWQEIDTSDDLGRTKAIAHGIRSVPAIVINSKLSFVGVPVKEELTAAIEELSENK